MGIQQAEKFAERKASVLAEWSNPEDVAFYRSDKNRQARLRLISKLSKKSCCPLCHLYTPASSFVISRDHSSIACRSCFHSAIDLNYDSSDPQQRDCSLSLNSLFRPIVRYEFDNTQFGAILDQFKFSQQKVADACGLSRSYVRDLIDGRFATISESLRNQLAEGLRKLGVKIGESGETEGCDSLGDQSEG